MGKRFLGERNLNEIFDEKEFEDLKKIPLFSKSESKILLGLDRIRKVLGYFGEPQKSFESAVVSGTVGKGQICYHVSEILSDFMPVGLYISPHLVDFSERISIVEKRKKRLILFDELAELSRDVDRAEKKLGVELTYFEHATVLAFLWFREFKVPFAVLEVGLGGRLDAVSVAPARWSALGRIHYDHENFLGNTLESIAYEKVRCAPREAKRVVALRKDDKLAKVILDWAEGSVIFRDDIDVEIENSKVFGSFKFLLRWRERERNLLYEKIFEVFGVEIPYDRKERDFEVQGTYKGVFPLFENAVLSCVLSHNIARDILGTEIEKFNLDATGWKGRCEVLQDRKVIYDSAHNLAGVNMLADFVEKFWEGEKVNIVFAVMKDKRWREMLDVLSRIARRFVLTKTESQRALEPEVAGEYLSSLGKDFEIMPPVESVFWAFENPPALITGTTYLYRYFDRVKKALEV